MTERVYKIAILGNEGVGKTGMEVSVTYFLFVSRTRKNPKFKTPLLEITTYWRCKLSFWVLLESRFRRLLTSDSPLYFGSFVLGHFCISVFNTKKTRLFSTERRFELATDFPNDLVLLCAFALVECP